MSTGTTPSSFALTLAGGGGGVVGAVDGVPDPPTPLVADGVAPWPRALSPPLSAQEAASAPSRQTVTSRRCGRDMQHPLPVTVGGPATVRHLMRSVGAVAVEICRVGTVGRRT